MASVFALGAVFGVNTTSAMPSVSAAKAMARPWLPAEAVTTRGRDAGSGWASISASSALNAPRILNEWVRFSDSSFSSTRRPAVAPSGSDSRSGLGVR